MTKNYLPRYFLPLLTGISLVIATGCDDDDLPTKPNTISEPQGLECAVQDTVFGRLIGHQVDTLYAQGDPYIVNVTYVSPYPLVDPEDFLIDLTVNEHRLYSRLYNNGWDYDRLFLNDSRISTRPTGSDEGVFDLVAASGFINRDGSTLEPDIPRGEVSYRLIECR